VKPCFHVPIPASVDSGREKKRGGGKTGNAAAVLLVSRAEKDVGGKREGGRELSSGSNA